MKTMMMENLPKLLTRSLLSLVLACCLQPAFASVDAQHSPYDQALTGDNTFIPQQNTASPYGSDQQFVVGSPRGAATAVIKRYLAKMALAAKNYTPQIREAMSNYNAAKADIDQAKGQRLPQIDVGLQSNPVQFGSGQKVPKEELSNGLNINMKTPVFDWGYNSKTINSKEFTAKAAEAYYQAQYEDTSFQVCSQLAELAKQKQIYQISQAYVVRMQKLVKMIGDISTVDAGRISELTQAQARMLQAEASRDSAESKVRDAEIALRKLTGKSTFTGLPPDPVWGLRIDDPNKLMRAVGRHPTLIQAKNQAQSALEQAKAVKAGNLPKLDWVVSKTVPLNQGAYEESWQTYLNVSWGLFRGGSAHAQEEAAALRAEAAQEQIDEQKIDLSTKVRSSLHNVQTYLDQANQYHRLVAATDQVRRDFFEQWRQLSTRTLLDVLTAESDYYNNQVNEITTRFNAYTAMFTSYANAGLLNQWLGVK
ncbi:TolC family protein [Scandinavium sp. NPDC088450]|uniref:TolC family protein n=1 Tax=Scandinavium sp. NPDC088450 TaxID=3364514 RepID=UPI00384D764E